MTAEGATDGGSGTSTGATGSLERPYLGALLDAQPLPAMIYSAGGAAVVPNAAAAHLLTTVSGGAPRVLAQDGTDLWTVIVARCDEAAPFFDIRLRLRVAEGQASEATMTVVPVRGSGGMLAGAVVFVLNAPSQRLRETLLSAAVTTYDFPAIASRLGKMVGAARIAIFEVDPDFSADIRPLAEWSCEGDAEQHTGPLPLQGTALDTFAGRRLVCVPSDLSKAYPDDPMIALGGFESMVAVALANASGTQVGVLSGLWKAPLGDVPGTCAAFSIVAREAAHALIDLLAKRELMESEQRYGSVFEGSAVPILLVEPQTTQIVDANPAACRLYGYPRAEFITMSVLQIDALAPETVQAELQRALDGTRSNFIGRHMLSGGHVRDVEVSIGPILVGGRQLLYLMIGDITERKRMEAEIERSRRNLELVVAQRTEDLLRANTELQQASTARDMVFVNLAQELRTSLQTITGFSDLLAEGMAGSLNEEQRRQVEMIRQAGKRLAAFAAGLVEAQRHGADELACEREEFDLVSLVESVLFGLASFAEDKGLSLTLRAETRPIAMDTDRYKLQQILLNLLSNAIRYTDRGGVTVDVALDGESGASVAVTDTGPGLPPEKLTTLFDGPEVHDSAAGIGLPASKNIAARLGGTIEVMTELKHGSVFTLRVPIRYGESECDSKG